jgi:hypothetical protein
MKIKQLLLLSLVIVFFTQCKTTVPSFYNYKTECLGVELDGSHTLKAWGKGRYWKDAADQAKKNAVRDVIFKGILDGSDECKVKPLLMEVNAEEKYQDYFAKFFKDGGEYKKFVSLKDERIHRRIHRTRDSRNQDQSTYSVVVRVLRKDLEQKLINDNILKK